MKFLERMGAKLFNMIVLVGCLAIVYTQFKSMQAGEIAVSAFIESVIIVFVVYKIFRTNFCQSLLCRFFGWDPILQVKKDNEKFNRWYDSIVAQKRAKQAEEARRAAAREDARNKAYFHANQARKNAGTYEGYRHANQAKRYWNESK